MDSDRTEIARQAVVYLLEVVPFLIEPESTMLLRSVEETDLYVRSQKSDSVRLSFSLTQASVSILTFIYLFIFWEGTCSIKLDENPPVPPLPPTTDHHRALSLQLLTRTPTSPSDRARPSRYPPDAPSQPSKDEAKGRVPERVRRRRPPADMGGSR